MHTLLGAYILGGLDADERKQFEAHLDECARCRADATDFAPLPVLLSRADPADSEPTPQPDAVIDATLREVIATRRETARRRRVAAGGLVGAAAVAVTVMITTVIPSDGEQTPPGTGTFAMQPAANADVTGRVTLTPQPWGTSVSLELRKLPPSGAFTLRTMDDSGRMQPAASWTATPDGVGVVKGVTGIPMPKLRKLNIVDADNVVLATIER